MKLSWSFFLSSLYCTASATRPSVSPDTARLIIAQRLGLSRFHSIGHVDADAIRHINAFGGRKQKLFGADDVDRSKAHLLMWIEDGTDKDATVVVSDGSDRVKDFTITGAPSPADNNRLIEDLIKQAQSLPAFPDPKKQTYKSSFAIEALLSPNYKLNTYNEYLNVFRLDKNHTIAPQDLGLLFGRVIKKAEQDGFAVTIITIPASTAHTRRENPEALLSINPEPSSSPVPPVANLEKFPVINQVNNKDPVRGILPRCFSSMSSCQKQTHNCSSHGQCALLHKGVGSGPDQQTLDCYGCACVPTVEKVGEDHGMESKQKVTYWGGPACQKQDISSQFWLFVGTGVVLAFLVSSGIGMLYSMGSEELPSVIGAGVSGPVRK
ncbi:hypothetical protein GQ44DRAFT_696483 [Phaeosphaeriaceae sp. PMI808]|nr:hypothetical protein GQ44DRAFT_696483 [Phaeosphaeriaceae sp. PMI808]